MQESVILYIPFPALIKRPQHSTSVSSSQPFFNQVALRDFSLLIHTLHRPCITCKMAFCSQKKKETTGLPFPSLQFTLICSKTITENRDGGKPLGQAHSDRCEALALVGRIWRTLRISGFLGSNLQRVH